MVGFIIGVALTVTALNGAFTEGQKDPEAKNIFAHKVELKKDDRVYGVDTVK